MLSSLPPEILPRGERIRVLKSLAIPTRRMVNEVTKQHREINNRRVAFIIRCPEATQIKSPRNGTKSG